MKAKTSRARDMYKEANEHYTQDIIRLMQQKAYKDYGMSGIKRSAHTKALAVLQGRFQVNPHLPPSLRIGMFKESKAYDVWIRISNASMKARKDNQKDVRGFALKMQTDGGVQDFLLVSTKYMPIRSMKGFHGALGLLNNRQPLKSLKELCQDLNWRVLLKLIVTMKHETSPLDLTYYSLTTYAFGDRAVKYALAPTSSSTSQKPLCLTSTYLKDNMKKHLASREATFDFLVQFQQKGMSLEDASQVWDEQLSPYIKVGKLTIPVQAFDTYTRQRFGEALTYSPGHAGKAHQPLGEMNKARTAIYEAMQRFRCKR